MRLLGSLERQIMQLFWAAPTPSDRFSVRDVHVCLSQQGSLVAYTTVMTVMSRLAEKGLLGRRLVGRGYRYEAKVNPKDAVFQATEDFMHSLEGEFGAAALVHFVEVLPKLDPALAKRLRKAFEQE
ncbi:MAG: BlaI/MecI/CopY family transcriptional regulator [Patescibacteria group bacterium]